MACLALALQKKCSVKFRPFSVDKEQSEFEKKFRVGKIQKFKNTHKHLSFKRVS